MMVPYGMGGLNGIFGLVTWVLLIALLVAGTRWLWKKGDK